MVNTLIQFKRGLSEDLPILEDGEPGFATDTETLWIGNNETNIEINPLSLQEALNINTFLWGTAFFQNGQSVIQNQTPTYTNLSPTFKPSAGYGTRMYSVRSTNMSIEPTGIITLNSPGVYEITVIGRFKPVTFDYMPAINVQASDEHWFNIYFPVSKTHDFEVEENFIVKTSTSNKQISLNFKFANDTDKLVTYTPPVLLRGASASAAHISNQVVVSIRKISGIY